MGMKQRVAVGVAAIALAIGGTLAVASPAMALSSGELTQACRTQAHGTNHDFQAGWTAHLYYPSQGVYGWKCYYNDGWPWAINGTKYNLSVQGWCDREYGNDAHFSNQSDAYSWYCA